MTIDYLERVILDIAQIYEAARGTPDEFSKESKFQFLGAYLRMLKDSIELAKKCELLSLKCQRGRKMNSQILDTLRTTRACEISSIKADLLDLTGTDEAKRWERIRRMREALSLLSDKIESDYKQMSAFARLREREVEKAKIKARISDLKAEINELEARL